MTELRGPRHYTRNGESPWPEPLSDEVIKEWQSGKSAKQIAVLHGLSRNAVIGKIYRLKRKLHLPPRIKDIKPVSAIMVTKRIRKRDRTREILKAKEQRRIDKLRRQEEFAKVVQISAKQDELVPGITILELTWDGGHPSNCRAPLRKGADGHMLYCGETVEPGESFCRGHCARFFNYQARKDIRAFR